MYTLLDYRDGAGARNGVPGPGGTSKAASTTTRRISNDMRSELIMGVFFRLHEDGYPRAIGRTAKGTVERPPEGCC
jgi:hypothetical protein